MSSPDRTPFVGPRPIEEGRPLYGRDAEVAALFHSLQARRIVLLHSPSGAGKSSLIQAGLSPRLKAAGFDVWPTVRVHHGASRPEALPPGTNRYLLSAMTSLQEGLPERYQRPEAELATLDFASFLEKRPRRKSLVGSPVVLVFDQFEEVLTTEPRAIEQKHAFFDGLGRALDHRGYWALFAMREDYLGALASFRERVPTHLSNTFRLDLLTRETARAVAVRATGEFGREFPGVDLLIEELAKVKVQGVDEVDREEQGLYVEPVHLQVVGHRLWSAVAAETGPITEAHVREYADVSTALARYYADAVRRAADGDEATEREIREWVGGQLIDGGIRTPVRHEARRSGDLDNRLIGRLVDSYLVRTDQRAGGLWYELAHDRMVEPVTTDNREWEAEHLHQVQRWAKLWVAGGRSSALLIEAAALPAALRWAEEHPERVTEDERRFLGESKDVRDREAKQRRRERALFGLILMLAVGAAGVAGYAWVKKAEAEVATASAEAARAEAAKERQEATLSAVQSINERITATVASSRATWAQAGALWSEAQATFSAIDAEKKRVEAEGARQAARRSSDEATEAARKARNAVHMQAATALAKSPTLALAFLARVEDPAPAGWAEAAATALTDSVIPVNVLRANGAPFTAVAVSDSPRRIVAGTDSGELIAWNEGHPSEPQVLLDSDTRIREVAVSGDGGSLAWITADTADGRGIGRGWLKVGETGDPQPLGQGVWALAFALDGTLAVGCASGAIHRVASAPSSTTNVCNLTVDAWRPAVSLAWLPDSSRIVAATHRYLAVFGLPWNPSEGEAWQTPTEPETHMSRVVVSRDGQRIAALTDEGRVAVYRFDSGGTRERAEDLPAAESLAFVGDAHDLALGGATGRITLARPGEAAPKDWAAHREAVAAMASSADGTRLVTASTDGTVRVWGALRPPVEAVPDTEAELWEAVRAAASAACVPAEVLVRYTSEFSANAAGARAHEAACVDNRGL